MYVWFSFTFSLLMWVILLYCCMPSFVSINLFKTRKFPKNEPFDIQHGIEYSNVSLCCIKFIFGITCEDS